MKLLIVDDGQYVVEYLKHLLDWRSFGIEHVLTSTNSIEAKHILDDNGIDILITDIRMPEVSGIDLLEHIHQSKLKTKVIFLSGYSQFDYAQKAIRLGILDYLLKPVDKEDMEKAIAQAIKSIEAMPKAAAVNWQQFDGLGFLLSLLCETIAKEMAFEQCAGSLDASSFCFFKIADYKEIDEATIRDYNGGLSCFIWRTDQLLAGLVRHEDCKAIAERIANIELSDEFQLSHTNRVRHQFYLFFHNENMGFADYASIQDTIQLPSMLESEGLRKAIMKRYAQLDNNKLKLLFLMELIASLYKSDSALYELNSINWIFNELQQPDEVLQQILTAMSQHEKCKKLSNEHTIRMIHDYVEAHLGDGLSLEELGEHVHLHPVYLSKLYKQETGENLSAYISMKRLEKASRLLIESNLHVVDISQMVGYKKTQYFIKLFKEKYGVTPQQYRRQQFNG